MLQFGGKIESMESSRLKRLARLLPTPIGVTLGIMMQVGPNEAEINVCKWPKKLWPSLPDACLHGAPTWLLYLISTGLILTGLIWFFWPSIYGIVARLEFTSPVRMKKASSEANGENALSDVLKAIECSDQKKSYVPLYEAAQRTLDSDSHRDVVQGLEPFPEDVIRWYCHKLRNNTVIYGRHFPSTKMEKFEDPNYDFGIENGVVIATERYGPGRWEHLAILEIDLRAAIGAINVAR